jgi:RHS repeat-associated protein
LPSFVLGSLRGPHTATYSYVANSPLPEQITFSANSQTVMTTTRAYDQLNRLTAIASVPAAAAPVSFAYAYNAASQRTALTNADASRWTYEYDALGQVTSGKKYGSDGSPVAGQQFAYAFDDIGNRRSATRDGRTAGYTANQLNQYTARTVPGYVNILGEATNTATVSVLTAAGVFPASRHGDYWRTELAVSNSVPLWLALTNIAVLQQGTNADLIATNRGHLLVPQTPETFTYDADGNLTSDSLWTNTWDGENRRTVIESRSGVPAAARVRVQWTHLPDGRWIERIVSTNSGTAYQPAFTNRYVWDGNVLLAVLNHTNGLELSFLRGLDLSGTPQGAGGVGGLLFVGHFASAIGYHAVACDGNGNVTALVNAADGTESARYEFGPFGEPLRITGPMGKVNPLRFSTQFADDWTGDLKYLFRDYRPDLGRWPNRDPLLTDEGLVLGHDLTAFNQVFQTASVADVNLYGFSRNDPLGKVDPFGLMPFDSGCRTVRFTQSFDFDLDAYLAGAKVKIENRTLVQTCPKCCKDGSMGDLITTSGDYRVTGEVKAPVGVFFGVQVRVHGGVSGGGSIMDRVDTCTGKRHQSGCYFWTGRFGVEGCAGIGPKAEMCLRGEANYTSRTCADPALNSSCLSGRLMGRVKILWRTYDYIFWQTSCPGGPLVE